MVGSSYSDDISSRLSSALSTLSPEPSPSSSPSVASTTTTRPAPSTADVQSRLSTLTAALNKSHHSRAQISSTINSAFPPFQGVSSIPVSDEAQSLELLLLAKLTINSWKLAVDQVMAEAGRLEEEDNYWEQVQRGRFGTGVFLVQTLPVRLLSATSTSISHFRSLTTEHTLPTLHQLRSIPPSLLLTSMFPHLSSTSTTSFSRTFLLSLSPLSLTTHEITLKRRAIRTSLVALATQLGDLQSRTGLKGLLSRSFSPSFSTTTGYFLSSTYSTVALLSRTFASPLPDEAPGTPADLAHALLHFVDVTLPKEGKKQKEKRAVVFGPVVGLWAVRYGWKQRQSLLEFVVNAKDTVQSFLFDWVLAPLQNIVNTIRHSDSSLNLMPKESLKSDLESLERMVIEFGRDQYGLSGDELAELGEKVRVGDLSAVMRVWESDIKSPVKSALTGNLLRPLLIQVQKVKVDTLVMVNGIEKMLASQQLTFGFVGVAPALMICVGVGRWLGGWFGGNKREKRAEGMRAWSALRKIDALVVESGTPNATTTGFLLLSLSSLREYADTAFPSKDSGLREDFLEDVRSLESSGDRVGVERLWRWAGRFNWGEEA
ncbi:nuclear control of ATPase protein [Pseudohyphozyma bogoriensis]|nr:nuclear control of ATPase protein [Pseudohyphozyma bogoriensis]